MSEFVEEAMDDSVAPWKSLVEPKPGEKKRTWAGDGQDRYLALGAVQLDSLRREMVGDSRPVCEVTSFSSTAAVIGGMYAILDSLQSVCGARGV